ncbi:RusA family crossover junction endodeoxyribonuclease [Allorhizocola rhizosphaerae]|uniref:RusA family crossover junction endodeoxyribonuclease n=1 Tax=Allorhizocola rhizosphaerae TaxID=1872709 RepID=UPI000E3C3710|nr:RusA family crossover junction endodeoxyribonuclease [Allorhizocola rhizosphaerae]
MPSVHFVVRGGLFVSCQDKNPARRRRAQALIAAAGREAMAAAGHSLFLDRVQVSATLFYLVLRPDPANVQKDILDALEGVVYANDRQVHAPITRAFNLSEVERVEDDPGGVNDELDFRRPFLHIYVTTEVDWTTAVVTK